MIVNHITQLIGNTPLLQLPDNFFGVKTGPIYLKCELFNPFGSVKDRIAWGMVKDDIDDIVANNKTVVEFSSGNTAKALATILSTYKVPTKLVSNRLRVAEKREMIELLGGEVYSLTDSNDCPDPDSPNDPIRQIQSMVDKSNGSLVHTSQYTNLKNPETHATTTAVEILDDVPGCNLIAGALGTAGSTRGIGSAIRHKNANAKMIGVVYDGVDLVPGIRSMHEMAEVGLFNVDSYDNVLTATVDESIDMMMHLIRTTGVLAGPSTGSCLVGLKKWIDSLNQDQRDEIQGVAIACDRIESYIPWLKSRRPDLFGKQRDEDAIIAYKPTIEEEATTSIESSAAAEWISNNTPVVIDTRANFAYRAGHIPGSINISEDALLLMLDRQLPFEPHQPVLLVCAVGTRTRRLAAYARTRGGNVWSLGGGINGWRDSNQPLTKSAAVDESPFSFAL
jgi:cysteine synthase/rhodanese-related sulfurtransferase